MIRRLQDRIALVTGGSRGIGLAIAQALARQDASVVLAARDRRTLQQAARQTPGATPVAADVTHPAEVKRLFAAVRKRFGRLDLLVNSAGVFTYKPFERTTPDDWHRNLGANLTSLFLTTRAALPLLTLSQAGHIVNILSISSREAFPKCSAYTASKFGALGFTRVLAEELRARKIRVTAILPGPTDTRMAKEFDFPVAREALLQPEDVAEAVLAAVLQPARANVNEVLITPSRGAL
jgi:NAD(P)-dependent dehydrogenase (short-subunit alcohol dehydrogenase family)